MEGSEFPNFQWGNSGWIHMLAANWTYPVVVPTKAESYQI